MSVQDNYNIELDKNIEGLAINRESSLTYIAGQRIFSGRAVRISDTSFEKVVPVANNTFRVISTLTASQTITLRIARLENNIVDYYNFTIPFSTSHTVTMNNLKSTLESGVPNCSVTLLNLGATIPNYAVIKSTSDDVFLWLADADVSGGGWALNTNWQTIMRFNILGVSLYKNGMPTTKHRGDTVEVLIDGMVYISTLQDNPDPLDYQSYFMGGGDNYEDLGKLSFVQNKNSNVLGSNFRALSGAKNFIVLVNLW